MNTKKDIYGTILQTAPTLYTLHLPSLHLILVAIKDVKLNLFSRKAIRSVMLVLPHMMAREAKGNTLQAGNETPALVLLG